MYPNMNDSIRVGQERDTTPSESISNAIYLRSKVTDGGAFDCEGTLEHLAPVPVYNTIYIRI